MVDIKKSVRARNVARNLGPETTGAVALSYLVDALLLVGFALAGTITFLVPCVYLVVGLGECAMFYLLAAGAAAPAERYGFLALQRLVISGVIQLSFMAIAPAVAFYFMTTLFVLFAYGSMGVSLRQSLLCWFGVVTAVAMFLARSHGPSWIPQASVAERVLVWLCFAVLLGRSVLIGAFGRAQRIRLKRRSDELRESVATLRERDQSLERVNSELQHQATHDSLTGLANRVLFAERLQQAVSLQRPFAVCVLDLDRFKVINDSLGHGAGDSLLKQVARRLGSSMRADDTAARAGGDEFLVLLHDVSSRDDIARLAGRWIEALSEPCRFQGTDLYVSPSIGIARFPTDSADSEELLARADEAMYHAKQSGRNTFRFFDAEIMGLSRERLVIEAELRHAIGKSQFQLHYQPKIDIATGKVRSVEALIRWDHPTRGLLLPDQFLPTAEDTGLIVPLGEWVIREACRQASHWQVQGLPFLRIAVNVSFTQFRQPNFPNVVREALESNSLDSSYLEIELTEKTLMNNAEKSAVMLDQLSRLGVVVAIDDFGTGYSSMNYLQRFPVDKLKIDLGFIRDLETNPADASIVRAIISLAHGLRLKVVAEGVESAGQLDILKRMGCDQYQGFLGGAAVPACEIEGLIGAGHLPTSDSATDRTFSKLVRLFRAK
jgi:diguanylate cyclase (GGDEF)-like protein